MDLYKKLIINEKGSALILTMVVLIAGVLIFSSIASISLLQRSASSKVRSSTEAFQIADSCVEWSLKKYYEVSAGDSIDSVGGINSVTDVFTWDDDIAGATINMPDTESYEIDCKVYLVDQDGNIIDSSRSSEELIEAVAEIRVVADAGFGDDETRRAVQVGLSNCPETFTDDRDSDYESGVGQEYKAVKIGDQCWMAENLNIGTRIDGGTSMDGSDSDIERYCYDNDSNGNECDDYGGLYQWDEAMQGEPSDDGAIGSTQGICPDGWHLPTDDEWHELELYLDTSGVCDPRRASLTWECEIAGTELKSGGTSGFESLLVGWYDTSDGAYKQNGTRDSFWSSTESSGSAAYARFLHSSPSGIDERGASKVDGFPVRCIK